MPFQTGFINHLSFSTLPDSNDSKDGTGGVLRLAAAVGQEHRRGRWWRIREAKNSVVVVPLRLEETNAAEESGGVEAEEEMEH